jgi:IS30 family transposase
LAAERLGPGRRAELARLLAAGARPVAAAGRLGVSVPAVCRAVLDDGGMEVVMVPASPAGRYLSLEEREDIAHWHRAGASVRQIGRWLGRPASTISRELARNSPADGQYRAVVAQRAAFGRARRPRRAKLAVAGPLRDLVVAGLEAKDSPEQIANRLAQDYPLDPEMRVCAETIYQAIYVESRGGLKREVQKALRSGRAARKTHKSPNQRRPRIAGLVPICERPTEADDRTVPGHWEGDLIMGAGNTTAICTLVERTTGFCMLGHLPGGHTAEEVYQSLLPLIGTLPDAIRRTLTWDQGSEMALQAKLAIDAGIDIYFADPHSPWQRGSNENTNGLLRQYFPKGTDLSIWSPQDLARVADQLNCRPRKRLNWDTPCEAIGDLLGLGLPRQKLYEHPRTAIHLHDIPKTQPLTTQPPLHSTQQQCCNNT